MATIPISHPTRLVLLCLTFLLLDCSSLNSIARRERAPDFNLINSKGGTSRLSDYKGDVVLVDFWATWCTPCKVEEPWLADFEELYRSKGFIVLGISVDDGGWSVIKPYILERRIKYPILLATTQVERSYGEVDAWPTTFLIDRAGRMASKHVGLTDKRQFIEEIETLLTEKYN